MDISNCIEIVQVYPSLWNVSSKEFFWLFFSIPLDYPCIVCVCVCVRSVCGGVWLCVCKECI